MKPENIVAVSFLAGGIVGIAAMSWVVFYPLPWWRDDTRFTTYPDTCIVSDLGTSFQVYCPL